MTLDSVLRCSSLVVLVTSVLGLAFAMRSHHRQVKAQILFQISDRYHNLLNSYPQLILSGRPEQAVIPEPTPEFTAAILRYLIIVHFAHVLRELKYLPNDVWRIVHAEHQRTLATPLAVREWPALKCEFETFPRFISYIDSINSRIGPAKHSDSTSDRYQQLLSN